MTVFFEEPQEAFSKSQRQAQRKRKARKAARSGAIVLVLAILVALIGTVAAMYFKGLLAQPDAEDFTGPAGEEVIVSIPEGATGTDMGLLLKEAGVVASEQAFIKAYSDNPRAASIQPGYYRLSTHISGKEAVAALLDPASRAETVLTLPEGMRNSQVFEKLAAVLELDVAEVTEQAKDVEAVGLPEEAGGILEGWLAPGQYEFDPGVTVTEALGQMVDRRIADLEKSGIAREQWQRQLIIASIAEKEVRRVEDYPKVARAIENRLAQDMPLQVESSVMYALNKSDITPSLDDLNYDSPYNTSLHKGLPPGPICNPNIEIIKATVNPPEGDWLFWVTVNPDTGETKFAATNEEHEQNAQEFRAWVEAHPDE